MKRERAVVEILRGGGIHFGPYRYPRQFRRPSTLKSGITYLGENRLLVTDALAGEKLLQGFELVDVPQGEEYAANCIRVNDHVLFAAGFPKLRDKLDNLGYNVIELEMSEFQKMDGGLSCLSLRF